MKKVKMRTTGAGPAGVMPAGAVVLVSDELALELAAGGWAEMVKWTEETVEPPPVVKVQAAPVEKTQTAPVAGKRRTPRKKA